MLFVVVLFVRFFGSFFGSCQFSLHKRKEKETGEKIHRLGKKTMRKPKKDKVMVGLGRGDKIRVSSIVAC